MFPVLANQQLRQDQADAVVVVVVDVVEIVVMAGKLADVVAVGIEILVIENHLADAFAVVFLDVRAIYDGQHFGETRSR